MNLLLLIIAIVLFTVLAPLGIAYTFVMSIFFLKNPFKYIGSIIKRIAVSIDQLGNVVCGDLFNVILIKQGTAFGHEDDTVSKVLHLQCDNLTFLGKEIYNLLEFIDPGHGVKSLTE